MRSATRSRATARSGCRRVCWPRPAASRWAAATGNAAYVQAYSQLATLGVLLPYSRTQESEADEIGLMLMAKAGYDPQEAVALWRNFEALGGARPPEFLSTHPAAGTRIERLEALMPKAREIYAKSSRRSS